MADTFQILLETIAKGNGAAQTVAGIKAVDAAQAHLNQTTAQAGPALNQAAGSTRNMGNAMLQGSRALQDMQYGLAGAVNNLEGIASALGLGAGVAGAVTVLAVAVQTLGPKFQEWFKQLSASPLDKLKEDLQRVTEQGLKGFSSNEENAARIAQAFTDSLHAQAEAVDLTNTALDASVKILGERLKIEEEIEKRATASKIKDIEASNLPPEEKASAIAALKVNAAAGSKARADQLDTGRMTAANQTVTTNLDALQRATATRQQVEREREGSRQYFGLQAEKGKQIEKVQQAETGTTLAYESGNQKLIDDAEKQLALEKEKLKTIEEQSRAIANRQAIQPVESYNVDAAKQAEKAAVSQLQGSVLKRNELGASIFEQQRGRADELQNAQREAVRGMSTGAPAAPFGPQPLPTGGTFTQQPASPFGAQPLPGAASGNANDIKRQLDEANAALAAMGLGIATLATTAKKTAEQVKNSR